MTKNKISIDYLAQGKFYKTICPCEERDLWDIRVHYTAVRGPNRFVSVQEMATRQSCLLGDARTRLFPNSTLLSKI